MSEIKLLLLLLSEKRKSMKAENHIEATLIRSMVADDLLCVARIEQSVHVSPWSVAQFKDLEAFLDQQYWGFVAIKNDLIVGYAIFQLVLDEIELLTVGVDKNHKKQRIAFDILSFAFEFFILKKQVVSCFLEVRRSNKPAQGLYHKLGFVCVGARKNYYEADLSMGCTHREDALIYKREFV